MAPQPKEGRERKNGKTTYVESESNGTENRNLRLDSNYSTENTQEMIEKRKQQTGIWPMIIGMVVTHLYFIYCLPYMPYQKWQTLLWNVLCFHLGGIGISAGAHRLWTHHSFKATLPLKIILVMFYSVGGFFPYSIYHWARDHRVHHLYTDTDMDPYSAERGFFFSHMGWLMLTRHPDSLKKLKEMNIEDILKDKVVRFEKKNQLWLISLMCFTVPTLVPVMFWQESWVVAFNMNYIRWMFVLHSFWTINSFAHLYGLKPFNKNIYAAQNLFVSMVATGEGWHNFHHMFPWDYRASDFGFMNVSMHFIRFCKFVGLASDLKTASPDLIKSVMLKYGDGSHPDWVPIGPEIPEASLHDPEFILPDPSFTKHM